MEAKTVEIEIYDKRQKLTTIINVEKIAENVFRTTENEIFNCRLSLGAEFETRLNHEGKHEIIKILKDTEYTTRRFLLNSQFTESEYRLLGDEIIKQGGFWQVDFGSIATINIPKYSTLNIDQIFDIFGFKPSEITE